MRTGVDATGGTTADGGAYEYLDHTADVQIHSWGRDLRAAAGAAAVAMFGIITDLDDIVEAPPEGVGAGGDPRAPGPAEQQAGEPGGPPAGAAAGWPVTVDVGGHDVKSAVYNFLDECLFAFCGDARVYRRVEVDAVDRVAWKISARGYGERFDRSRHTQGTEVKAITYSAMQVTETPDRVDIYVIVDI